MTTTCAVTLLSARSEPLGRIDFAKAVKMLLRKVAVVVDGDPDRMLGPHPWPRVVRLVRDVARTWYDRPAHWHRGGVFIRDRHRCAYCGGRATTIDHIFPRSRGGRWSWTNCVAACEGCNFAKADRTPHEAGMVLRYASPYAPTLGQIRALAKAA